MEKISFKIVMISKNQPSLLKGLRNLEDYDLNIKRGVELAQQDKTRKIWQHYMAKRNNMQSWNFIVLLQCSSVQLRQDASI